MSTPHHPDPRQPGRDRRVSSASSSYRVISLRRNPEPKEPDNLTPFFDDDVLEGAHLERALGVSLIALVIVGDRPARLLHLGAVPRRRRPTRASRSSRSSAARCCSPTTQSEAYNSTKSLLCADCHGVDGGGGVGELRGQERGPALRSRPGRRRRARRGAAVLPAPAGGVGGAQPAARAALRYDRQQLTQIITYGRPGTPMPAWGVASGKGALQEQSIQDLVNYVESIVDHARQGAGRWPPRSSRRRRRVTTPETRWPTTARRWPRPKRTSPRRARSASATPSRTVARERASHTSWSRRQETLAGRRATGRRRRSRHRRADPVHEQLRAVPHAGVVVLRSHRPLANPSPCARWAAAPTGRTSPTAT